VGRFLRHGVDYTHHYNFRLLRLQHYNSWVQSMP